MSIVGNLENTPNDKEEEGSSRYGSGKADVSGTPSTSQVSLVAEVSSTVSSGRATECSISSAGSSTSKSLSCSQVVPFIVVLATSLIQHMVSAAVSVNSFFSISTFLLKALLRPGARPRVALLSVRLCLRARLWVQGRGRRAGASPWRMGGGPPGQVLLDGLLKGGCLPISWGAGLCVEQGWGLSAAAEILPREEGGLWIPPYSLAPIFSGVLTVPGVVQYTTWFIFTTQ